MQLELNLTDPITKKQTKLKIHSTTNLQHWICQSNINMSRILHSFTETNATW